MLEILPPFQQTKHIFLKLNCFAWIIVSFYADLCLATGAGKTGPSCPFWTAPLVTRRIARNLLDGVGDGVAKSGKRTLLTIINALVFS